MSKLVPLEPEPLGADVVACLESALKDAKAGRISSCGLALVYRDGSAGARWSKAPSIITLIGAVGRLEKKLHEDADGAS